MAIFGFRTARQRLRRATRQSLTVPPFSSPLDCTPWVTGGLWPAELSAATGETAALAEYLKADLDRIASAANDKLSSIRRAGIAAAVRRAEEAAVIDEARALAVRRVDSTVRQLRQVMPDVPAGSPPPEAAGAFGEAAEDEATEEAATAPESDDERLQRLTVFVARQEPRLNWAVGDYADGTTMLVTDLAHGWIPPGITLPEGVRLLGPERRTGKVAVLLGDAMRSVSYSPGDSLRWSDNLDAPKAATQPRELSAVDDLGAVLTAATHCRDGLPPMVHTLARAAAAGTGVAEAEIDLLRVHLDTARYQILDQYPDVDPALLLNCMLLATTEGLVAEERVSANYHLAWFRKLTAPQQHGAFV
ncbi:DUF5631 domain-containing protein [Mycobacterium decipiens]|uniref:Vegetative cell wall protein n=1 Tax=Mycobacterium decipiens TaxID=1430326 RepID=A0A1X2LTR9_9MYCO|nr:DUF5631 domain-containing protein [Mycobacterium decipiens]OSC40286.1 hypothetical protein B8W66_13290 [Mycobacterium decipiens]